MPMVQSPLIAAVEVQHAQARSAATERLGKVEHVLGRTSEAVQGSGDERVASFERVELAIELRP